MGGTARLYKAAYHPPIPLPLLCKRENRRILPYGKGNAEKLPDDSFTEEDYVADKGFPPSKIKEKLRERPELYPPLFGAAEYLPG